MYRNKFFAVLIIVVASTWVTANLFDYRYKMRWQEFVFNKIETCITEKINYDVLFFGDSRVQLGINPFYFDSVTHLNSYNLGYMGGDAKLMNLFSYLYLQKHTAPKAVFINVDEYAVVPSYVFKEAYFLLYYLKSDPVAKIMQEEGFPTSFIKIFPFTKYCFFNEYNRISILAPNINKKFSVFETTSYKGFTAVNDLMVKNKGKENNLFNFQPVKENFTVNDSSINFLQSTIRRFLNLQTKVFLFYPPGGHSLNLNDQAKKNLSIEVGNKMAKYFQIPYLRFDTLKAFTPELFYDNLHLNKKGSVMFSTQMGLAAINELK